MYESFGALASPAGFLGQREPRRHFTEILHAALFIVNVDERAHDEDQAVAHSFRLTLQAPPVERAVGIADAEVHLALRARAHRLVEQPRRLGLVVGVHERAELLPRF